MSIARPTKQRVAAASTILLWGYIAYVGYSLTEAVIERMGQGYHDPVKWRDYFYFPLFMVLINVSLLVFVKKLPAVVFITLWVMQFFVLFVFAMCAGGGM